MNSETEWRIKKFEKECNDVLFGSKDHDYNASGIDILDYYPYGVWSALTEINRKVLRLMSLYGSDIEPENESVEDTWHDLLNYTKIGYGIVKTLESRNMPKHRGKKKK